LIVAFLAVWLVGWAFGEISAVRNLLRGGVNALDAFMGVWLVAWTIGGGVTLYLWLWMLKGQEHLLLRADALVVKRKLWEIGRTREYDLQHIKNLRVAPRTGYPYEWSSGLPLWGIGGGSVAFDYGSQTVRVAASVDEAEAREIIRELKAQHSFADSAA
jgi:hypothetical protein